MALLNESSAPIVLFKFPCASVAFETAPYMRTSWNWLSHRLEGSNVGVHTHGSANKRRVNIAYLCGQGYDCTANMAGGLNGTQAVIQQEYPAIAYTHCVSHCLIPAL